MVIKPSKKQDLISGEKRCHFFTDGWQNFKFNEIFEFISNNTFTRNDLSNTGYVKNIHYGDILTKYNSFLNAEDNGIPYININIDLSKFEIKSYIKSGDIIIADTAEDETVGKAVEIINVNCLMLSGLHTLLCRPKIQFADKFLGYYLNSAYFHNQLIPFIVGTKVSSISRSSISQTCLIVPKIGEQKKIAEALADIDSLICLSKKLITKKKAIKQGAMQELLTGKTRLPGFTGAWYKKYIGKIGEFYGGLTGKNKNDFGHGSCRYITFMNVLSNPAIDISKLEKVDVKKGEIQNKVQYGDLFFNTSSETPEEVGMCSVLLAELENTYLNSFCFGFRLTDDNYNPLFLSYLFNSNIGRKIMSKLAQGATRYNLSKSAFSETIIKVPDKDEQDAIANVLSDMDNEINALEQKLEKYRQIKQGMMEQLLTGKIRLI